jgi:MFS transporter, FSR family, fosmidomycin resistance protein
MRPYLESFAPHRRPTRMAEGRNRPRALALLLAVIGVRNVGWFGLITFVPLYEVARGNSQAYGNRLLALMLLAGGIGTLVAGPVADRIGRRPVLLGSIAATGPLILAYLLVGGPVGAVALALAGVSVIGTFGVSMVMSQEYLPRNIGLASGLTIGFAIGIGGVAAVALGALADTLELRNALYVCAAVPVLALLLGARLPSSRGRGPLVPEPVVP